MNLKSAIANLKFLWWWFRQVSGDAAYENYLRSTQRAAVEAQHPACHPESAGADEEFLLAATSVRILSREEFFLDSLRRRYSTISRCC